ncbi:hypothetical protein FAM09_08385 [Niastella caeni]|uniref:VCBS repeat-containing protein n=1 Tax=Niastella caeni TaxID=2569763 RepID=A0A4S8HW47_9BACT|nr:hypothetical protein [Niastella caeni]THU39903.1 hypothetical protein FAM09_08385 [Niastella caeni]
MKWLITSIILLVTLLTACKSGNSPWGKNKSKDTLSVHTVPYEVLVDKAMDSAEQMSFFRDYCIRKLESNKNEDRFYTLAVFDGDTTRIQFYKGNICSDQKQHAVVGFENKNLFFFFLKDDTWKLRQVMNGFGIIKDSAVQFSDVNFDGFKDVSIIWNYSAGTCDCSAPGCRDIYLYNSELDNLQHLPEIRAFFDFGLSVDEKSIYLGQHCKGIYGKYSWQDGKLQIQEEYNSNQWNEKDTARWHLEHFIYCDGEKVPAYTIPNLPLPEKWQKEFGW